MPKREPLDKRVVILMPKTLHLKLKSKLALKNKNVSEWVREKMVEYLKESK